MRTKLLCPDHKWRVDPLYYRDSSGKFIRWDDRFLCWPPRGVPHMLRKEQTYEHPALPSDKPHHRPLE